MDKIKILDNITWSVMPGITNHFRHISDCILGVGLGFSVISLLYSVTPYWSVSLISMSFSLATWFDTLIKYYYYYCYYYYYYYYY